MRAAFRHRCQHSIRGPLSIYFRRRSSGAKIHLTIALISLTGRPHSAISVALDPLAQALVTVGCDPHQGG
jgi:hypothetical protein